MTVSLFDLSTERGCRHVFDQFVEMSDEELGKQDVAVMNLVCAAGLPSSDPLDIPKCLQKLDEWAEIVRQEPIKGHDRYLRNPNPNKGSEAVYRLWAAMHHTRIISGIEERFRRDIPGEIVNNQVVDRSMKPTGGPYPTHVNSQINFIHGLLSPRCLFNCVSAPVLFAAIGRRLGYPVKLILTVGHIFNRWVDENERFNMDGIMSRIGADTDEQYIDRWRPWRDWERKSTAFHHPLTPREELAVFAFERSVCERANLRFDDAMTSCQIAARLHPDQHAYVEDQWAIMNFQAIYKKDLSCNVLPQLPQIFTIQQPLVPYASKPIWSDKHIKYGPNRSRRP